MIANYHPSEWKTNTWFELCFDDGHHNGLGFPCTEDGTPLIDSENTAAWDNYKYALEHPEKYARFNKVVKHTQRYTENPWGVCKCGKVIELYNEYMGACECPRCGQWYNLFGQELNRPETWPDGDDW